MNFARVIGVGFVISLASISHAAEVLLSQTLEAAALTQLAAPEQPAGPALDHFAAGNWDVNVFGGGLVGVGGKDRTIYFGTAELEYFLWDNFSINADFVGYGVEQDNNAAGVGFNLLARWYVFKCAGNTVGIFVEGGAGLSEWDARVPDPDGTHFNFTLHAGAGLKWFVCENVGLIIGGKYMHLSNARLQGDERNPGFDGFGGFGGLAIDF